jgi:Hsp70 protein
MLYHRLRLRPRHLSVGFALVCLQVLWLWRTIAFIVPAPKGRQTARCGWSSRVKTGNDIPLHQKLSAASSSADGIGIGIDLGTTFSAVAYLHEGIPTIVPVDGERTMPSVVRFCLNDEGLTHAVVGRRACSALDAYRNVKRVIGTGGKVPRDVAAVVPHILLNPAGKTYKKDSLQNQIDDASLHPTKLVNVSNPSESLSPHVLSSYIIQRLKEAVTNHTALAVTRGEF